MQVMIIALLKFQFGRARVGRAWQMTEASQKHKRRRHLQNKQRMRSLFSLWMERKDRLSIVLEFPWSSCQKSFIEMKAVDKVVLSLIQVYTLQDYLIKSC